MPPLDIEPFRHNLALKQEFDLLGLDLAEVFDFTPLDLDLENRRLENLLDFVRKYQQYGSQQMMELADLCSPHLPRRQSKLLLKHRREILFISKSHPQGYLADHPLPIFQHGVSTFKAVVADEIRGAPISDGFQFSVELDTADENFFGKIFHAERLVGEVSLQQ